MAHGHVPRRRGAGCRVGEGRLDLSAKFAPPAPAGLARGRLLDLAAHRVVLVLAPAGHGKTTLLGQIASRFPGTVVWYRIDAADRDPAELAARIGRALGKAGLAGDCRSFDDVAAALDAAGRDLLLVFDDFHAVAGSEAEHGLARMIALAPPTLRVALGARRVVGLDVPALRVYGAVHVVDADDLRFRSWEVERLFREIYHQPLPPEDAATLSQRTGGWAAGLAMFHLLTEGRPPAQRRRALADLSRGSRLVRSYLVREVLGDLPAELREFLRRTSALGVLTGALCDALLDTTGSQTVLEELEQRRLFTTTPDDGHQFRYHQVLLDHLELELTEHLGAAASREWYGRAAELLLDAGRGAGGVPRVRARRGLGGRRAAAAPARRRGRRRSAGATGEHAAARPGRQRPVAAARAGPPARGGGCADRGGGGVPARPLRRGGQPARGPLPGGGAHRRAVAAGRGPGGPHLGRRRSARRRSATRAHSCPGRRTCPVPRDGWPPGSWHCSPVTSAWLRGCSARRRTTPTPTSASSRPRPAPARVVRLLAGKDFDDPATDLEALMLDAEVGGWPWLSRIGRALLALDTPGTAPAVEPCDPWGAAVVTFVDGLGRRAVEPLRAAAARFTELGAPVPALWAACLATALSTAGPRRTGPAAGASAAPGDLGTAVARARTLGLRDLPAVVDAWAAGDRRARRPRLRGSPPCPSAGTIPATPAVPLDAAPARPHRDRDRRRRGGPLDRAAARPVDPAAAGAARGERRAPRRAGGEPVAGRRRGGGAAQPAGRDIQPAQRARRAGAQPVDAAGAQRGELLPALPPGSRSDVLDFDARLADARARRHDGDARGRASGAGGGARALRRRPAARGGRRRVGGRRAGPAADRRRRAAGARWAGGSATTATSPRPSTRSARACGSTPTPTTAGASWSTCTPAPATPRPPRRRPWSTARCWPSWASSPRSGSPELIASTCDSANVATRGAKVATRGGERSDSRGRAGQGISSTGPGGGPGRRAPAGGSSRSSSTGVSAARPRRGRGSPSRPRSSTPVVRTRTTSPGRSEPGSGVPGFG